MAVPRSYVFETPEELVIFDGLPLLPDGTPVVRAARLAERWDEARRIEGAGAAVRADLMLDRVELVTAPLAPLPLFMCEAPGGGRLVSNSVLALRLLADLHEPDPLGVSSLLALGWTVGDRTLAAGIRALPGGSNVVLSAGSVDVEQRLGPATLASRNGGRRADSAQLAERLVEGARPLAALGVPIQCPLTAGRDSRLCLAVLRAAGVSASCYTVSSTGEADVQVAADLARSLGLAHTVDRHDDLWAADAHSLARGFVFQNDGLCSLEQIADHPPQLAPVDALPVKVSGLGGEIARAGFAPIMGPAAAARPFASMASLQRRLLSLKARAPGGAVRHEAVARTRDYLRGFVDVRRGEGWPAHAAGQAFYAFERVGRWAATGVRRTAPTADLYSPFFSSAFVEAAFAHTGPEWVTEHLHYQLMSELAPGLRDAPYADPWPAQRPRLAGAYATLASARAVSGWLRGRSDDGMSPVAAEWTARHASSHLEVVGRARGSGIDELVDLGALERELSSGHRPGSSTLRALSVIWWLYGLD